MIFIVMNYKAMKQFLTKIEIEKDCIELTYLKFNGPSKLLKIPLNELTVEYFGNGIGVSSLISNHIGKCVQHTRLRYIRFRSFKPGSQALGFFND